LNWTIAAPLGCPSDDVNRMQIEGDIPVVAQRAVFQAKAALVQFTILFDYRDAKRIALDDNVACLVIEQLIGNAGNNAKTRTNLENAVILANEFSNELALFGLVGIPQKTGAIASRGQVLRNLEHTSVRSELAHEQVKKKALDRKDNPFAKIPYGCAKGPPDFWRQKFSG